MNRRGIALLVAIVVLAVLGVISATGLALGLAERSAGVLAVAEVQARGAAEAAIAQATLGWPASRTPVAPGGELVLSELLLTGPSRGRTRVRALGGRVYSIRGVGERVDQYGRILAAVRAELLVVLDSIGTDSLARPRAYPRGWRLLP